MEASMRMTVRLLLRAPGLWVVSCATAVLIAFVANGVLLPRTIQLLDMLMIPIFFLGQLLLTIALSQQERADRSEELLAALPYAPWRLYLGRAAGIILPWLAVSLMLWLEIGMVTLAFGGAVDWLLIARHWLMVVPISLLFTTALGLWLGQSIKQPFLAYVASALLWIGLRMGPILTAKDIEGAVAPPIFEFLPSGLYFPLTDQGLLFREPLLYLNRLYALGFALLLASLLIWRRSGQRRLQTRPALLAILLAGALVLTSAFGIVRPWKAQTLAAREGLAAAPTITAEEVFGSMAPEAVAADRYRLDVKLDPGAHRLTAAGSWVLTNWTDERIAEPTLSLRYPFTLAWLKTAAGEPVPFRREGNLVRLERPLGPGESIELQGEWSGEVWEFRLQDGPQLGAHISTESILLPANWGWYPIAGDGPLQYQWKVCSMGEIDCDPRLYDGGPVPPASFELTVTGSGLNLLHNGGERANGLYLVGTPYRVREVEGVELAISPLTDPFAAQMAKEYAEPMRAYQAMVPGREDPLRMIEVSDEVFWSGMWDHSTNGFPNATILSGSNMGYRTKASETTIKMWAFNHLDNWWRTDEGFQLDDLPMGLAHYMYRVVYGEWQRNGERYPAATLLWQLDQTKGREAATQVLRELYAAKFDGGLTPEALQAAVLPLAGDDPQILAALGALKPEGRR